jgi:hypothetical protein
VERITGGEGENEIISGSSEVVVNDKIAEIE